MPVTQDMIDSGVTEEMYAQTEPSGYLTHPGEHLREDLDALGWSAGQLAKALGVPKNRITLILNGQRGISADTAIRLGRWLDVDPTYWLNLQNRYELRRAHLEADSDTYAEIEPLQAVTA